VIVALWKGNVYIGLYDFPLLGQLIYFTVKNDRKLMEYIQVILADVHVWIKTTHVPVIYVSKHLYQ
jgi:hypothetical protein